jgi:hypothetical protein
MKLSPTKKLFEQEINHPEFQKISHEITIMEVFYIIHDEK